MKLIIDCGHGGTDSGAIGLDYNEKDYNLEIGKMLIDKLKEYDCIPLITRDKDVYLSLSDRVEISNKNNCDVFISIHCNSYLDSKSNGFESFSYTGNSSLQKSIHTELTKVLPLKDRGMKKANFYVLKHTKAKAVLLELGFISNKNDSTILYENKSKIVNAIVNGIVKEYNLKSKSQYTVQLGVFNNKDNAEKLVNELKEKGYKCIIKASV